MRHRKKRAPDEVTLNLAAMLDMAFQLLTFFILTFKPVPVEGQILLRMPPAQPPTPEGKTPAGEATSPDIAKGLNTLTINVNALPNSGNLGQMSVGDTTVTTAQQLKDELRKIFSQPAVPFEQVIIQVDSGLRYEELMKVVGACAELEIPDPADPAKKKKLTKLSFVEKGVAM